MLPSEDTNMDTHYIMNN